MRWMPLLAQPPLLWVILGCASPQAGCPPVLPMAIAVDVRDSVTNRSLVSGATGVVLAGAAGSDTMRAGRFGDLSLDSLLVGGWWVGPVDVRIQHPGYLPWMATDIQTQVRNEYCGPWDTRILTARLQPEPR
jgi:hypothetical protein